MVGGWDEATQEGGRRREQIFGGGRQRGARRGTHKSPRGEAEEREGATGRGGEGKRTEEMGTHHGTGRGMVRMRCGHSRLNVTKSRSEACDRNQAREIGAE